MLWLPYHDNYDQCKIQLHFSIPHKLHVPLTFILMRYVIHKLAQETLESLPLRMDGILQDNSFLHIFWINYRLSLTTLLNNIVDQNALKSYVPLFTRKRDLKDSCLITVRSQELQKVICCLLILIQTCQLYKYKNMQLTNSNCKTVTWVKKQR